MRWAQRGGVAAVGRRLETGFPAASIVLFGNGARPVWRPRLFFEFSTIAPLVVEWTITQINRRVKDIGKLWLEGGAEAILQLRAAQLSQDDRWKRYWARPRKHRRAVGSGRLAQGV